MGDRNKFAPEWLKNYNQQQQAQQQQQQQRDSSNNLSSSANNPSTSQGGGATVISANGESLKTTLNNNNRVELTKLRAADNVDTCGGTFDPSRASHGYSSDDSNIPKSPGKSSLLLALTSWSSQKGENLSTCKFDASEIKFKKPSPGPSSRQPTKVVTGNVENQNAELHSNNQINPEYDKTIPRKSMSFDPRLLTIKRFDALMRPNIDAQEASDERGDFDSVMITQHNSLRQRHQHITNIDGPPNDISNSAKSMPRNGNLGDIMTKDTISDTKVNDMHQSEMVASILPRPINETRVPTMPVMRPNSSRVSANLHESMRSEPRLSRSEVMAERLRQSMAQPNTMMRMPFSTNQSPGLSLPSPRLRLSAGITEPINETRVPTMPVMRPNSESANLHESMRSEPRLSRSEVMAERLRQSMAQPNTMLRMPFSTNQSPGLSLPSPNPYGISAGIPEPMPRLPHFPASGAGATGITNQNSTNNLMFRMHGNNPNVVRNELPAQAPPTSHASGLPPPMYPMHGIRAPSASQGFEHAGFGGMLYDSHSWPATPPPQNVQQQWYYEDPAASACVTCELRKYGIRK